LTVQVVDQVLADVVAALERARKVLAEAEAEAARVAAVAEPAREPIPERWLYPVREVAQLLGGIDARTVYKMFDDGRLRRVRVGGRVFVDAGELRAYVDQQIAST
jgi:excisionase family DNA binding protein